METLFPLLVIGAIAFFVIKAVSKSGAQAKVAALERSLDKRAADSSAQEAQDSATDMQRHEERARQAAAAVGPKGGGPTNDVEFAIGETESSAPVQRLIEALGPASERSTFDDSYYLIFKGKGVSLCFAKSGVLLTAFLYADGEDGYAQYSGSLPSDLSFSSKRREVEAKLGSPQASGGGGSIQYWTTFEDFGVTYKSKSEVDLDNQIAHVSVRQRGLFLETSVAGTPTPASAPPNPVPSADDVNDEEVDAALEQLRVACETDPERGLALIDGYSTTDSPAWNSLRVLAYRRILVGSEADARSGRYGHTLDEVAHRLSPHKLECGIKALHLIAEIEREEPDYFSDGDVKENILDAVCHLMERARPGIVQQTLGWTKLDYFGAERVSRINEKVPGGKELRRVFDEVEDRVLTVRFKADTIVRSALAMRASGPGPRPGRGVGFMLFERLPDRSERVVGDRIHVGSVDIGENGDWRYTPKGDGPSIRGGPMFQEKAEQN